KTSCSSSNTSSLLPYSKVPSRVHRRPAPSRPGSRAEGLRAPVRCSRNVNRMITAIVPTRENYLTGEYGVRSWLLTQDHKRIALLYLAAITFFFFLGGIFATIIRLELLTPPGDLVSPQTYNKLFTLHGVIMVFLFLVPSIPA